MNFISLIPVNWIILNNLTRALFKRKNRLNIENPFQVWNWGPAEYVPSAKAHERHLDIRQAYVARNATIFKNNHKGDRAFGSILHRRPVRPDSRFLSRSLFTIFEINPIIILLAYTNSNTDIDTGKRKFNSYSRYLKISEQKWKRTWWLFPLYDSNSECFKISWKY